MIVSEIMTEGPVCVKEGDFATHARQVMRDYLLRGLVVVNEANRLVGMLSDQDILRVTSTKSNVTVRGYARECPTITPEMDIVKAAILIKEAKAERAPVVASTTDTTVVGILSITDLIKNLKLPKKAPKTIGEIMTRKVETCKPEDRVTTVWTWMLDYDYTGMPVVSEKGEILGMVTRRDMLKSGFVRIGSRDTHESRANESPKVQTIMSTPVYTLTEYDSVERAIQMILHYDIGRITIVNGTQIVGIVDRQDLLKALLVDVGTGAAAE